jgi:hypothetical protein
MSAMCYAASKEGFPGYVSVVVDDASDKCGQECLADFFKESAKRGYTVQHVTRDQAADGLTEFGAERKRRELASLPRDVQIGLFR